VAGWEGWTPVTWRPSTWPAGALVQAPVHFFTPATLPSGDYRLIAGLLNPENGEKNPPTLLDTVTMYQRAANFTAPVLPAPLTPPVQFGAHALLLGYNATRQDNQLMLTLYWQVLQTLLPPHHIFIHLDSAAGETLAQRDDAPQTAVGPAPTGSWQPGEYLATEHALTLPDTLDETNLHVGLYLPESGVRLPATSNGEPAGDAATISLAVMP
jgi:hypothetical protein